MQVQLAAGLEPWGVVSGGGSGWGCMRHGLSFSGGGGPVATEQVGCGGRSRNHRGDPRDMLPVEIWEDLLEEANCLQGAARLTDCGGSEALSRGNENNGEGFGLIFAFESLPCCSGCH